MSVWRYESLKLGDNADLFLVFFDTSAVERSGVLRLRSRVENQRI